MNIFMALCLFICVSREKSSNIQYWNVIMIGINQRKIFKAYKVEKGIKGMKN